MSDLESSSVEQPKKLRKLLLIIWLAFTVSIFIYAAILYMVKTPGVVSVNPIIQHDLRPLLYLFSIVIVIIALYLYKGLLRQERLFDQVRSQVTSGKAIKGEEVLSSLTNRFLSAFIFSMALCDLVSIFGLVLVLLGEPFKEFVRFAFITLTFYILWGVPRIYSYPKSLEQLINRMKSDGLIVS